MLRLVYTYRVRLFPLLLLFVHFASNNAAAQAVYTVTDLGTLPGESSSIGYGINRSGQVAGQTDSRAFLYSNGHMQDLGTLPGGVSAAGFGINNSGHVTGWSSPFVREAESNTRFYTPTGR